jgi:RING-H2 zinc finger domain
MKKVFWVNSFKTAAPLTGFNVDTCAICRNALFTSECDNCLVADDSSEQEKIDALKDYAKQTWILLLMLHRRPECLFSMIDRNVLARIYALCLQNDDRVFNLRMRCPVVQLKQCKHAFHWHCFTRWTRLRQICPLCNSVDIAVTCTATYGSDAKIATAALENVYVSENPFVTKLDQRQHHIAASAYLHRTIKNTHGGVARLPLFYSYQLFFAETLQRIAPLETRRAQFFQVAIDDLIRKEFIYFDDGQQVYRYNP